MGISLPVRGLMAGHALQLDAGLFLGHLGALKVGLAGGLLLIGLDFLQVLQLVRPLLQVGVLGGHHHVGGAVEGVGAGGVHSQLVPGGGKTTVKGGHKSTSAPVERPIQFFCWVFTRSG